MSKNHLVEMEREKLSKGFFQLTDPKMEESLIGDRTLSRQTLLLILKSAVLRPWFVVSNTIPPRRFGRAHIFSGAVTEMFYARVGLR